MELFIARPLPVWVGEVGVDMLVLLTILTLEFACSLPPDPEAEPAAVATIYQPEEKREFTITLNL